MNRIDIIRSEEKKYHESCYENYKLFQAGTWLHKPVTTVIDQMDYFHDRTELSVLDLGCGVGRNSIPISETLKHRYIKAILSDVETFVIQREKYDFIIAVSVLEHLRSRSVLENKLYEMAAGTSPEGINCIIINSNVQEIDLMTKKELDPMFEVNIPTDDMVGLLERQYEGWKVETKTVKNLEFDIERSGRQVKLMTDCITFVAKKL